MSDEISIDTELETLFATFGREEVIEYIKSLEVEAPKPKAAGKTKAAAVADEGHPCEYATKSKEGVISICPKKNAKNEHDGMWFCGTEKSGHYKSTLAASKKVAPAKAPAKATVASKNQDARTKASALVQKVTKVEKLNATEVVPGSGIFADLKHFRIVFDKPTQKAYGVLDEDKETILPLTEEAITFLEALGVDFDVEPPAPAKKTAAKAPAATKAAAAKAVPAAKAPAAKAPAAKAAPVAAKAPAGKAAPVAAKAPAAKAPAGKPAAPAKPAAKAPPKAAPAAKALAAKAPVAKPAAKAPAAKAAPAKAVPTKAPVAKPVAKAPAAKNAKSVKATEEDQETLDALKQSVEDALTEVDEAEPDAEEEVEEVEEVEEEAEIDLGEDEEQEPEVEEEEPVEDEEDDSPDIEEVEEGEAADDEEEEEEVAEDD